MTAKDILKNTEDKMKKAFEVFQDELKTFRTGRANPEVFKRIRVECYGSSMSLTDVAGITVPDGRSFLIQPFDKANLKAIETGIVNSDLSFNPSNDGSCIRINIPPLSEDRRKELIKTLNKTAEDKGRVVMRSLRRDSQDQIKELKKTGISEDEIKKALEDLEKLTLKYVKSLEEAVSKKEIELKTI